jgi:hypothetical protein
MADDGLFVVLVTLSEPAAAHFAQQIADSLSRDRRFEIVRVAARPGWHGGAADIIVRSAADIAALDAVVDHAVRDTLPYPPLTLEAVIMVEVVPAGHVPSALARGHVAMREALHGMGLY